MEFTKWTKICEQNGAISELYTDDKKSKYSSNPNDIYKSTQINQKR